MVPDRIPRPSVDAHWKLRERVRRAAQAESAHSRAAHWTQASPEERVAAFVGLVRLVHRVLRARAPLPPAALGYPRISSRRPAG